MSPSTHAQQVWIQGNQSKESVGTGIKDHFEWEVQAFWDNNATLNLLNYEHKEPVNKPVGHVTLEGLDAI